MRAPMQVLAIPYLLGGERPLYCILKRSDAYYWHFISGGVEDYETPPQAALRQAQQEIGAPGDVSLFALQYMTYIPAAAFAQKHRDQWPAGTYLIPEYCFALRMESKSVHLSHEHVEYCWMQYEEVLSLLRWQSNAVALYELNERIKAEELG